MNPIDFANTEHSSVSVIWRALQEWVDGYVWTQWSSIQVIDRISALRCPLMTYFENELTIQKSRTQGWKFCSQKVTYQTVFSLQVLCVDRTRFEWPRVNEHSWIVEWVWHPVTEHRIKVSVLLELSLTNTNTCLPRDTCFWLWVFTSGYFSPWWAYSFGTSFNLINISEHTDS